MNIKTTKIGGVEIKRTYRPTRIVCDVVTLTLLIVLIKITIDLMKYSSFVEGVGILPLLFPIVGFGMCAAYVLLTFRSLKFGKYKITKQNAQRVYDWWAFSLSLVKVPLLFAMSEGEYMYYVWVSDIRNSSFSIWILLYLLLAVIIMRLSAHRIKALTAVKKSAKDNNAVKVRARLADDDNVKQEKK